MLLGLVGIGCGESTTEPSPEPCAEPSADESLAQWLEAGCYTGWPGHAQPRKADMTPGYVRVFLSPALNAAVHEAREEHAIGAMAVREIYAPDQITRLGWSASIKTANGWFWFERFSGLEKASVAKHGAPGCIGCHEAGTDFVQSNAF